MICLSFSNFSTFSCALLCVLFRLPTWILNLLLLFQFLKHTIWNFNMTFKFALLFQVLNLSVIKLSPPLLPYESWKNNSIDCFSTPYSNHDQYVTNQDGLNQSTTYKSLWKFMISQLTRAFYWYAFLIRSCLLELY